MATLWIREYGSTGNASQHLPGKLPRPNGAPPIVQEPGTDQVPVAFTASAQSAAFGSGTTYIAITASADFHYVIGPNPTATTNALKVSAGALVHVGVQAGHKIAAIAAS